MSAAMIAILTNKILIAGVSRGILAAYIIKVAKFIKYEKYETMVKDAKVQLKINEGKTLSETAYIADALYVLSQILTVII
jgi:hypothetical protein